MNKKTPLKNVLGLGSAKTGQVHWSMQRLTAIALIPLTFWLVAFIKKLSHTTHADITLWLAEPLNSLFAISFIMISFYHAALGLQTVIEDYTHSFRWKIVIIWVIKLSFLFLALFALLSLLRIILG